MCMIEKYIAIAALARNCEDNLPGNIDRIENLRKSFSNSIVVVYENDSTDRTPDILNRWSCEKKNVFVVSEHLTGNEYQSGLVSKNFPDKSISRISKMVYLRNRLLTLLNEKGSFDYVLFIDIDLEWFSVDGLIETLTDAPEDWGAIVANGRAELVKKGNIRTIPFQYDDYAYLSLQKSIESRGPGYFASFKKFYRSYVFNRFVKRNRFVPCGSAFGGIGLYKWDVISNLKYELVVPPKLTIFSACICEHIPFHNKIRKMGYSIYVSQSLIATYYRKHMQQCFKDWFYWNFPFFYTMIAILFKR